MPLPPVIPILAHQGPGGWKISPEFSGLFGTLPEALRPYLVSFRHGLIDLARIEDSALRQIEPNRAEEIMASFGQAFAQAGFERGHAQGHAQGLAEGEVRGEARGEAKALVRLLDKRFGAVPMRLRQRISAADLASIEAWFDRAIQAPDVQSVFDPEVCG